jgi:diguanylate cyclase (GGDEF)-like protein/PAS domain S-box-containing protein
VRALEAALVAARAGEERFRALVESIEAIAYIADWDVVGTIRYISPRVETVLGSTPEQWYGAPSPWQDSLHPDDAERVLAECASAFSRDDGFASEYRMIAADGRVVWIAERETIVRDADGRPSFCHGVMFDITRLKLAEERLKDAESALRAERDLAQHYLDVARTLLLVLDRDGRVRLLNQHGHELLGYPAGSLVGADWFAVSLPDDARELAHDSFRAAMDGAARLSDDGVSDWTIVTATGERRTVAWRHRILRDADGTATGVIASAEDVTDRLHAEREIRRLAFHDHLTGLPNRTHFDAQLRAAVAAAPAAGHAVGLLFVDLDSFKLVNDSLGHAIGDELLRAVAGRLDGVEGAGLLGRHGGDEFLVLLPALPGDAGAASAAAGAVVEAVAARLAAPFGLGGHTLPIEASVGVALFPHEAEDGDGLMRLADAAMYRAKGRR